MAEETRDSPTADGPPERRSGDDRRQGGDRRKEQRGVWRVPVLRRLIDRRKGGDRRSGAERRQS